MPILSTSDGFNRGAFTIGDWLLFSSISLIWGSSFLLMDIGLEALAPGAITWLRVVLGAAVLLPMTKRPIPRSDRPAILLLSLTWVAIPFTLFPLAQQHINSAVTGMLNGAMPLFAASFASMMLRRLPGSAQLAGLVVGFTGVVAISLPEAGSSRLVGVALALAATICYGLAVNVAAPLQQRYGSVPVISRMLGWASLWTAPLGLTGLQSSRFEWGPVLAVSVAGLVGTGLAFVLMATLVGRVGSTRASFITYLIPVVALFLGVTLRGDEVTPVALLGVVLVVAGALAASRPERQMAAARSDR
ncbi:MAG: hypothetical conserved integral membrane protein [Acidimicrobiia bacterium]|nr:MAG: hypothetical conserved integral membrane protein [Acidimicrobiia bacterium]